MDFKIKRGLAFLRGDKQRYQNVVVLLVFIITSQQHNERQITGCPKILHKHNKEGIKRQIQETLKVGNSDCMMEKMKSTSAIINN